MDLLKNIPIELKELKQWILWKLEEQDTGKPTKIPYSHTGYKASVINSNDWCTFNQAFDVLLTGQYSGLGFVLTEQDPYIFIDLDEAKDEHDFNLQKQIFDSFESYSELSPSGNGLHIICKGNTPSGKKKFSSEIYSSKRYMTMTGNVYRKLPINDCHNLANSLWEFLGGKDEKACLLDQQPKKACLLDDNTIINRAAAAENGQLFKDLYLGDWQKHSYRWSDQSQSCADQALINIIQFYTKDINQIKRIFKSSALGKRDKAQRDGYLTICIKKAFDRELPQIDTTALIANIQKAIESNKKQFTDNSPENQKSMLISSQKACLLDTNYKVPPGLIGRIAQFIYASSARPVPEIAIGAALGLASGFCGRCYNISGTGLNQYVLILAATGTGKESTSSGIHKLLKEVKVTVPTVMDFIGPTVINSPQALIKRFNKSKSFVSIVGEFGEKLELMSNKNANPADKGVKTMYLDLFNKSGASDVFGAMAYSDTDKNIDSISSPAFSILAESTQESFYSAIDEKSIKSGLVPRFTVIEYTGDRPSLNENPASIHDYPQLIQEVVKLAAQCGMLNSQNKVINIQTDEQSTLMLRNYNNFVDEQIRGSCEANRQIWNRAHIKVLKLAGLLAVGINPYNPIVTLDLAEYAINLENANIKRLLFKFNNGMVGANMDTNEQKQIEQLNHVIRQWLIEPYEKLKKYNAGSELIHSMKVVPYKFLMLRTANTIAFKDDKYGATRALQRSLKSLEDSGDIQATKDKFKFNSTALVYAILNIEHFI